MVPGREWFDKGFQRKGENRQGTGNWGQGTGLREQGTGLRAQKLELHSSSSVLGWGFGRGCRSVWLLRGWCLVRLLL